VLEIRSKEKYKKSTNFESFRICKVRLHNDLSVKNKTSQIVNLTLSIHLASSPKPEFIISQIKDYDSVKKIRRKIFRMLKKACIYVGVMFTQLYSIKCKKCGKPEKTCACKDKQLISEVNIMV